MGETFDDGSLADAGLTHQDRVVLGAAGEDLDGLFDLVGAADHGIDAAVAGAIGEIDAVLVERRCGGLVFDWTGCGILNRCLQLLRRDAGRSEQTTRNMIGVTGQGDEEMFGVDVRRSQGSGQLMSLE